MKNLFNFHETSIIEDKIIEILNIISIKEFKNNSGIGLLSGASGVSLFFLECSRYFNNEKYLDTGIEILETIILQSDLIKNNFTFCNGLVGVGWLIKYAEEFGYIEGNQNILDDIDNHIFDKFTIPMINQNFYDFLHGAIGSGIYFLTKKENDNVLNYLRTLIIRIETTLFQGKSKFGLKYTSINKKIKYDLGLSHGISAILYFLVSAFESNILKENSLRCIKKITAFLLNNITSPPASGSYFPNSAENKGETSRLGWCYGDLGICSVLLKTSKAINDFELERITTGIIEYNAARIDDPNNGVIDGSLCHGSSGVGHIFSNWYKSYNIEKCRNAARFWLNYTLKMSSPAFSKEEGYKTLLIKGKGFQADNSLLIGNAGVGLSLLSAINFDVSYWDRCLLLQ